MRFDHQRINAVPEPRQAHLLNARERIPEEVDAWLALLAERAQRGDIDARNSIYEALQPRFAPIFLRIRWSWLWRDREGRSWTFDDLEQEAFLIVCDLIAEWSGGDGGLVGFIFARLPWRLRDTLRRWSLTATHEEPTLPIGLPADDEIDLVEVRLMLEEIFRRLPPVSAEILRFRAIDGLVDEVIAERIGVNVRTVRRRRQAAYRRAKAIYLGKHSTA